MRKFILVLAILSILLVPGFVLADKYGLDQAVQSTGGLLKKQVSGVSTIPEVIGSVVGVGLSLLGVAFFLLLLYAGFLWMTAMGDKGKIDRAKEILESAIIGLLIVIAAYAIATFVFSNIAGGGGTTVTTSTAGGANDTSACEAQGGANGVARCVTQAVCDQAIAAGPDQRPPVAVMVLPTPCPSGQVCCASTPE